MPFQKRRENANREQSLLRCLSTIHRPTPAFEASSRSNDHIDGSDIATAKSRTVYQRKINARPLGKLDIATLSRFRGLRIKVRSHSGDIYPWVSLDKTLTLRYPQSSVDEKRPKERKYSGFRNDYVLGETVRCRSHMIIKPTFEEAGFAADSLNVHNYAFVKRSDGSFSYAIVANRLGSKNTSGTEAREECLLFVVDSNGSIKKLYKKSWNRSVRLICE